MLTEAAALLLPCPLLDGKIKVIEGYYCEGSRCHQWVRAGLIFDDDAPRGDCYWLQRVRDHEREGE